MAFAVYLATGRNYNELINSFDSVAQIVATENGLHGFSLIDSDFYRTTRESVTGERFNLSLLINAGQLDTVTPHYIFKVYESGRDGSAPFMFSIDKSVHDYFPVKLFDMTTMDSGSPEDQVLGVIMRKAEFEIFPSTADQIKFNVAPQAAFPSMAYAAEVTGQLVPNDGSPIPVNGTGYALLYDSNGQRVRPYTGFDTTDTQDEGQVLIQNVHPTVVWPAGRRGLVSGTVRFTEETALGAPALIGMPTCCV